MKFRIWISKILIRFSSYLQSLSIFTRSLPIALLSPENLTEMTNQYYNHPKRVTDWSNTENRGLYDYETDFFKRYNLKNGKILAIGAGGGREAWGIAKLGFDVVAIDISEGIINNSKRKISDLTNLNINFMTKDVYSLNFPPNSFDAILFAGGGYSFIPSSRKRTEVLKNIKRILKKEGVFLLSFMMGENNQTNRFFPIYKFLAKLVFGNREIEKGDFIIGGGEFHHCFLCKEEIIQEAVAAGFIVDEIDIKYKSGYKFAYLKSQI